MRRDRLVVSQFDRFNHKGTKDTKKRKTKKRESEFKTRFLFSCLLCALCAFVVKSFKLRHYQTFRELKMMLDKRDSK